MSVFGSMSPNDSATGSVRSQPMREGAYAFLAAARSPLRMASVKTFTFGSVSSACSWAYLRYAATAASSFGSRLTALPPVTVTFWRMPLPFIPGLQAISYEPAFTSAVRFCFRPGPMFSRSATMRSSGKSR